MRISDWSSDVRSSDLDAAAPKPSGPAVDPAATPEGRAALREGADRSWTFRTRVTAPMAETIDREVKGRGGPIPVRVYKPARTVGALPVHIGRASCRERVCQCD